MIPEGRGDLVRLANATGRTIPQPHPRSNDVVSLRRYPETTSRTTTCRRRPRARSVAPRRTPWDFRFLANETNDYGSVTGHATFQVREPRPGLPRATGISQIPLVVANVTTHSDGNELYFDMTIRETSGTSAGVRQRRRGRRRDHPHEIPLGRGGGHDAQSRDAIADSLRRRMPRLRCSPASRVAPAPCVQRRT